MLHCVIFQRLMHVAKQMSKFGRLASFEHGMY